MKFTGTTQGMPLKEIIFGKKTVKLEIFKRSFSRTGAMLWNQISPNWSDISKPTFKKKIRQFLFQALSDRNDYVEVDALIQILKL